MTKWFPIVHGRTAFVDFRPNLIVVPEGFAEADIRWASTHILATTRFAEGLSGHPRWCVFRNDKYLVVGVTCMAAEVSPDMTREISIREGEERPGRDLFVFLGYVARQPVTYIPPMELELFKPLYEFVRLRWREKIYNSQDLHEAGVVAELPPAGPPRTSLMLNTDLRGLQLWPHSQAPELWRHAGAHANASLCLGFTHRSNATASPFTNATIEGVEESSFIERPVRREPEFSDAAGADTRRFREPPREPRRPEGFRDRRAAEDQYSRPSDGRSREGSRRPHARTRDERHEPCHIETPFQPLTLLLNGICSAVAELRILANGVVDFFAPQKAQSKRRPERDAQTRERAPFDEAEPFTAQPPDWRQESSAPPSGETHAPPSETHTPESPESFRDEEAPRGFKFREKTQTAGDKSAAWEGWDDEPNERPAPPKPRPPGGGTAFPTNAPRSGTSSQWDSQEGDRDQAADDER